MPGCACVRGCTVHAHLPAAPIRWPACGGPAGAPGAWPLRSRVGGTTQRGHLHRAGCTALAGQGTRQVSAGSRYGRTSEAGKPCRAWISAQ